MNFRPQTDSNSMCIFTRPP